MDFLYRDPARLLEYFTRPPRGWYDCVDLIRGVSQAPYAWRALASHVKHEAVVYPLHQTQS
jgi:hypothetical protein